MEPRVAALEADMKDVKAILGRFEPVLMHINFVLPHLATQADIAASTGAINALTQRMEGGLTTFGTKVDGDFRTFGTKLDAQDQRLQKVEAAIKDTIATALSKSLGVGAIVTLVGSISVIIAALVGAVAWTLKHFNLT